MLTLEELDQLGTLDSMPQYPLDSTWYVDKVCGPWSVDSMDAFGTLDSLNLAMDSAAWGTASIYFDAPANITSAATNGSHTL